MLRQAEIAVAADDQVIVHREVQGLTGLDHGLGQFLIRGRGGGIAARVIMDQDETGGLVFQGQLQDLSGINHRLVHRAFLKDLLGDNFVLAVQVKYPKLLVFQSPHGSAAVIHQHVQGKDALALQGLFFQIDLVTGLYQIDETGGIFLEAHELHQGLGSCVQDLPEGAEVGNEVFGQRLNVGIRNGKSQKKFQELIVLQRGRASLKEPPPETGPVAVVMRLAGLGLGLGAHIAKKM